jgi:hypothetical protein
MFLTPDQGTQQKLSFPHSSSLFLSIPKGIRTIRNDFQKCAFSPSFNAKFYLEKSPKALFSSLYLTPALFPKVRHTFAFLKSS